MTIIYVDSAATGSADGTSWANAYTTVNAAISAATTLDNIYISHTHSEALASSTNIDLGGKALSFYCVDDADNSLVSDYGASGNGQIETNGSYTQVENGRGYFYGLRFTNQGETNGKWRIGNGSASNGIEEFIFEKCLVVSKGSVYSTAIAYGENTRNTYIECDFDTVDTGNDLRLDISYGSHCLIIGGKIIETQLEAAGLFYFVTYGGSLHVIGMDFTNQDATLNLVTGYNNAYMNAVFERCLMPLNWSGQLYGGTVYPAQQAIMYNCDYQHDDTNNTHNIVFQKQDYCGIITQETTTVRDATFDGTHKFSIKIMADSIHCGRPSPLRHEIVSTNKDWSANDTVDIYFTSDTALNPHKFWVEGDFPSSSSGWTNNKRFDNRVDLLSNPSDYTSGQGSWTNGKTYTYKATLTLSGCEEGIGNIYACLNVIDATVYVCPSVEAT